MLSKLSALFSILEPRHYLSSAEYEGFRNTKNVVTLVNRHSSSSFSCLRSASWWSLWLNAVSRFWERIHLPYLEDPPKDWKVTRWVQVWKRFGPTHPWYHPTELSDWIRYIYVPSRAQIPNFWHLTRNQHIKMTQGHGRSWKIKVLFYFYFFLIKI